MNDTLIEIIPMYHKWNGTLLHYDVTIHGVPSKERLEGTHYEKIGSVPRRWVGFLTAEEVGQEMGGN